MSGFRKWGIGTGAVLMWAAVILGQPVVLGAQQQETAAAEKTLTSISLHSQSAVLLDGDTGRVLYGKNEDQVRPMASTTKIMTCILALEKGNLDDVVRASANAASQPKVHLGVSEGEEFLLGDLLYSLMLESHNDTAVMIAEHISGTTERFADEMNRKAVSLGCKQTYFITPNGLDAKIQDEDGTERIHGTTAADLARIMAYCVNQSPKREDFLKITQTSDYYFTDLEGKRSFQCVNHNALLTMMEGVISGKTGFTGGAGYTYVGAMESEGRSFIIALLGCGWPPDKTFKWSDARKLFEYATSSYQLKDIYRDPSGLQIPVEGGIYWNREDKETEQVQLCLEEPTRREFSIGDWETAEVRRYIPESLKAPVEEGQQVGRVEYWIGDWLVICSPVYAAESIEKLTFMACIGRGLELFLKL